jgi:hypothetical protein
MDWVGGQGQPLAALPAGKTRYSSHRRLGEPQGRSGRVRNISPPPGFDPRTVQPVASCYTDSAIPALRDKGILINFELEMKMLIMSVSLFYVTT